MYLKYERNQMEQKHFMQTITILFYHITNCNTRNYLNLVKIKAVDYLKLSTMLLFIRIHTIISSFMQQQLATFSLNWSNVAITTTKYIYLQDEI